MSSKSFALSSMSTIYLYIQANNIAMKVNCFFENKRIVEQKEDCVALAIPEIYLGRYIHIYLLIRQLRKIYKIYKISPSMNAFLKFIAF